MNHIKRLDWMTDEEYKEVYWYYGCVCDYDMHWEDEQDYEAWCKRVLGKQYYEVVMIKIKVYDKATDKQTATVFVNSMREYKKYLTTQVDHNTQYVFGVRL